MCSIIQKFGAILGIEIIINCNLTSSVYCYRPEFINSTWYQPSIVVGMLGELISVTAE